MKLPLEQALSLVEARPAAYVLLGADGFYLYKGACRDLRERLRDHHAGRASRTKNRRPLSLLHFEYYESYSAALKREVFLKSGTGRDWLRRLREANGADCSAGGGPAEAGNLLA
jgi:putative endonuclease